jgi:hypothetical protein
VLEAIGCSFDDIVDVTTFHTDPEKQFETIMKVKKPEFLGSAISGLDCHRSQLACRLRFRDQGDRPDSRSSIAAHLQPLKTSKDRAAICKVFFFGSCLPSAARNA